MAGKGSAPRKGANQKAYEQNWEKIFGKKQAQQNLPTEEEKQRHKEQAQDPRNG